MEHAVDALHGRIEEVAVQYVSARLEDIDARVFQCLLQVALAAAGKIVEHADFRDILFDQFIDRVRADQPGAADQQQLFPLQLHPSSPAATSSSARLTAATMVS